MSPDLNEPFEPLDKVTRVNGPPERTAPHLRYYEVAGGIEQTVSAPFTPPTIIQGKTSTHTRAVVSDPLDIYPGLAGTNSALNSAINLLDQANAIQKEALVYSERGEVIAADDALQRLRALLPELFCCRAIGDGFGAVVNAIHYSFVNTKGAPFEIPQIRELGRALHLVRRKPFLSVEEAVGAVILLEEVGLIAGPEGMQALADLEPEEGVS